jgi:uncharacterized protein YmfQ (DUF2313 family)
LRLLKDHTLDEHADILADYLPNGYVFASKKINGTNLRKFLRGCAYLFKNAEGTLNEISGQYDIQTTVDYIEEWEAHVGIPDDCFDTDVSIEERRKQVLFKMASFNVQTEQDFIDMAANFGVTITIDNSVPFQTKFIGAGIVLYVPPFDVPFIPGNEVSTYICWTRKLIDAVTNPIFENS